MLLLANNLSATEIIVTSTSDANTLGTFRYAIETLANDGDTIWIDVKGTITLNNEIQFNTPNLLIIGPYPKHNTFSAISNVNIFNIQAEGITFKALGFKNSNDRVFSINQSNTVIENCLFESNNSTASGSCIYLDGVGGTIIRNCSFINNHSNNDGGVLYIKNSIGKNYIVNSTFSGNSAGLRGGALYCYLNPLDIVLINNVFINNFASAPSNTGAALYINDSDVGMYNNVISNNGSGTQPQIRLISSNVNGTGNPNANSNIYQKNLFEISNFTFFTQKSSTVDLHLTYLKEDGYGLKYYRIDNSNSPLIGVGTSATGFLNLKDCRRAPRVIGVNIDAGTVEYSTLIVTNNNNNGVNSLSNAVQGASNNYIEFDINVFDPNNVSYVANSIIQLTNTLTINGSVYIDGYSQPGSSIPGPGTTIGTVTPGSHLIKVTKNGVINNGFDIQASNVVLAGLEIYGFDDNGVEVNSSDCKIVGNHIGFYQNGVNFIVFSNKTVGVKVKASNTMIGGNMHWQRNVISCNGISNSLQANIRLEANADNSIILGNFVGVKPNGNSLFGSYSPTQNVDGIAVINASNLKIGDKFHGTRNIISANKNRGILLAYAGTNNVEINNNYIGLGYNGTTKLPNINGIETVNNPHHNSIGEKKGNVISGNSANGINLNSIPYNFIIENNFIGTDATGTLIKPNTINGIVVVNSDSTLIKNNVISGNNQNGIRLASTGTNSHITGNTIGVSSNDLTALRNGKHGILVDNTHQVKIGGLSNSERNIISGNILNGIAIGSFNTTVSGNIIGLDKNLNIKIPNKQNGIEVGSSAAGIHIGEFGKNFIGGNLKNGIYLNNVDNVRIDNCRIGTDNNTVITALLGLGNVESGIHIKNCNGTLIGHSPDPSTSVTSNLIVDNTDGILIENSINSIIYKNRLGAQDVGNIVGIKIKGTSTGNKIGLLSGNRNVITHNNTGILLEGSGVSDNHIKSNLIGINGIGSTTAGNQIGIHIKSGATNNKIGEDGEQSRKNRISSNSVAGIKIEGSGNNQIFHNLIGSPNAIGVWVLNCSVTNNIGLPNQYNDPIISGNSTGVLIDNSNNQSIQNCRIGTSVDGLIAFPNTNGIVIQNTSASTNIGGDALYQRNIISGNLNAGIVINNCNNNSIYGNIIGLDLTGNTTVSNNIGIHLNGGSTNLIGSVINGGENIISANSLAGILIEGNTSLTNVKNNFFGTDITLNAVFSGSGNTKAILFNNVSSTNTIGGDRTINEGNVFSNENGISIGLSNSSNQKIEGNIFGLENDNLSTLGNSTSSIGVYLDNSNANTIGSTNLNKENTISNMAIGIMINNSNDNIVVSNYIGTDSLGNVNIGGINGIGIRIDSTAQNNTIGPNNVISGNNIGVLLKEVNTKNNVIKGNKIGINSIGLTAVPNSTGVIISDGASDNIIGGDLTNTAERNVISGNTNMGVRLSGANTDNNSIKGNYIGANNSGNQGLSNKIGIGIDSGAKNNTIGGLNAPDRNIIIGNMSNASNSGGGISIADAGTDNNTVIGNNIGIGVNNVDIIENFIGLAIFDGAKKNTIGGSFSNYICGSLDNGVIITGAGTDSNKFYQNFIGIKPNGDPAGNTKNGILISGNASSNNIGIESLGNENYIGYNGEDGVRITGNATGNSVLGNSIHDNSGLGIDIAGNGVTTNNIGTVQNGIDMPIILQAFACDATTNVRVAVKLTELSIGEDYIIELFSNTDPDASGYGEGRLFINRFTHTAVYSTDTVAFDIGVQTIGASITATKTSVTNGSTSEFSFNVLVSTTPVPSYAVTNETCQGSGDGSISINAILDNYSGIQGQTETFNTGNSTISTLIASTHNVLVKYLNGCAVNSNQTIITTNTPTFSYVVENDTCGLGGQINFSYNNDGGTLTNFMIVGSPDLSVGQTTYNNVVGTYNIYALTSMTSVNCMSDTASIQINAIDLAANGELHFSYPTQFCISNNVEVSQQPNHVGGLYSVSPTTGLVFNTTTGEITSGAQFGTNYTVKYSYGNTCFYEQITTPIVQLDASFDFNDYCVGTNGLPSNIVTSGTGSQFVFNPSPLDGAIIDPLSGSISNGITGTTYSVEFNTGGGCPGISIQTVTILELPETPYILESDYIQCPNDAVISITIFGATNANWFKTTKTNQIETNVASITPLLSDLQLGSNFYYTQVDNGNCKSLFDSINITIPDVSALGVDTEIEFCIGSELKITAYGGESYIWESNSQIDEQTTESITFNPTAEGYFNIQITDVNNCINYDSILVKLKDPSICNIVTYTAFSPNGDGVNDNWEIDNIEGFEKNVVYIYNRWGDLIAKIENYNNTTQSWRGKNQVTNRYVTPGTYIYIVEANGGKPLSGWVQIVK